jgi:signal transduction histidine kinase
MVRIAEEAAEILVSNLAMNAIQHSPANSIVCVSVHPAESVGTCIELEVADRGTGIAPENLANVFERFFREDPSRSRATGGAGLGLSICKGIVEGVGGSIALESHPGRGTVVKVLFRLA